MDDLLYKSCVKYFTSLANYGYKSEAEVKKLLFYIFIQELVNTPSVVISESDYKELENALYCIYGTTCLIPYPEYCENPMYLHLGDMTEVAARLEEAERAIQEIKDTATPESQLGVLRRVEQLETGVENLEGLDFVLEGNTPTEEAPTT